MQKICGALRDLALFVQFKKREKHPNQENINEIGSEEMTFCDGGIANNSVHIEETGVLDQDLASPKDRVTTLVLQKETMLRPLTNDEITTIMELCDKLQNLTILTGKNLCFTEFITKIH